MKKITAILLSIILASFILSACASEDSSSPAYEVAPADESWSVDMEAALEPAPPMMEADMAEEAIYSDAPMNDVAVASEPSNPGAVLTIAPVSDNLAEKIIYSYYANIETLEFDNTLATVNDLILSSGGFVEVSEITGIDFSSQNRGEVRLRSAYYVIRIPASQLNATVARLGELGNILNQNSNATNITAQFTDTQSRLNSLRTQEERLLDMLANADDLEILLMLENSLADVRYQIEWLTSTLNNWQRQVDYSTLTLNISEVMEERETELPPPPVELSYWEQMGEGLMSSLKAVGDFFASVFMWIVVNAPVLAILAAIGVALYFIIRRYLRKSRERAKEKFASRPSYPQPPYQQYPQQNYQQPPVVQQVEEVKSEEVEKDE